MEQWSNSTHTNAPLEPHQLNVEAEYEAGCFAPAQVLRTGAHHKLVKFRQREPIWHPMTVNAKDGQSLTVLASLYGYEPSLLAAANRSIGSERAKLMARTVVKLPAAVSVNGESLETIAARYNVEVADIQRHPPSAHQQGATGDCADPDPLGLYTELYTQILLPAYRPPGPAPTLPELSAEELGVKTGGKVRARAHSPCPCAVTANTSAVSRLCQPCVKSDTTMCRTTVCRAGAVW